MKLIQEINAIESTPKKLREFAWVMGGVSLLFVGLAYWKHREINWVWTGLAAFFFFFGVVWPSALKPLQKSWMTLAVILGAVMSRVILSVLFFLVITPISLILKIVGKDPLDRKIDKSATTYWQTHRSQAADYAPRYENQF